MELSERSAVDLMGMLKHGEISNKEIIELILSSIEKKGKSISAFVHLCDKKEMISQAEKIDGHRVRGEKIGLLQGIPIAVKDNICVEGMPTTCASRMLESFIPPYSATIIDNIIREDGLIIGKTNMDEFAMGSSTETSTFKTTRNQHNLTRVPGGSSGGSAAAVAADQTVLAIGSDTGGSVRQPASFCGVVGLKPTYGRVSRYGLIAYASSLDQIGTLTKSVEDAALLLRVIAGYDPKDSTSLNVDVPDYSEHCKLPLKPLTIGVPKEYFGPGLDDEVRDCINRAIRFLKRSNHRIVNISLSHTEYAVPTFYIIACAEASSNLARYDGVGYGHRSQRYNDLTDMYCKTRTTGFGEEVKRRIMLGTYVLSTGYYEAYYLKASKVRALIKNDFDEAFSTCDVIIHPVAPTPAFEIGEKIDDPLAMYLGDVYSVTANLAGLPAISVPCGTTGNGLPVGLQIVSSPLDEITLLKIAYWFEKSYRWKK